MRCCIQKRRLAGNFLNFFLFCPQAPIELKKRLDEIRLLESRKSARLADVDTDFARLADMAGDRRRASATIEVPAHHHMQGLVTLVLITNGRFQAEVIVNSLFLKDVY